MVLIDRFRCRWSGGPPSLEVRDTTLMSIILVETPICAFDVLVKHCSHEKILVKTRNFNVINLISAPEHLRNTFSLFSVAKHGESPRGRSAPILSNMDPFK